MTIAPLLAIAFSAALLGALCGGDPKRRRSARQHGAGHGVTTRWSIVVALCLPGLLFALRGDLAAFLIWLGGCGAVGWLITLFYGRRGGRRIDR